MSATPDEVLHYSPKKVDLINLDSRQFETIDVHHLLANYGRELPLIRHLVSILEPDLVRRPVASDIDLGRDDLVVTFDGLIDQTPFLRQVQTILGVLQEALGYPVDIEFAHDGTELYLLQCRPQSQRGESPPPAFPGNVPLAKTLFTANRFVTNGSLTGITHIVYVDSLRYAELSSLDELASVGRAVSGLNQILPRRGFLLMGPGRWGSRGDIRLGVGVSYSDISNAAMLIEVARQQEGYVPEPSFGTHFFQDLVESSIRYLPLYPDEPGILFNEAFLTSQPNRLPDLLPSFAHLADVVRVLDIPAANAGQVVQVLMNGETGQAIALLTEPSSPQPA